jgi:hypothetical protein
MSWPRQHGQVVSSGVSVISIRGRCADSALRLAARRFFRSAKVVTGVMPDRVTTDGHDAYPEAIRTELGSRVSSRINSYLNNRLEQDHRGIKGRRRPMLGFKSFASARRYCRDHDELRNLLRSRSHMHQQVPALHDACTTCAGQPSRSVFWKLLEREAPQPKNVAPGMLESRQSRSVRARQLGLWCDLAH